MQNRSQERSGAPKIDSKSLPGASRTPRGAQERPEPVSGASQERLGTCQEGPWGTPGGAQETYFGRNLTKFERNLANLGQF